MANTLITPDMITNEAIMGFHNNSALIGAVNRQYDSSFAKSGAKIGSTLRIRKPAQFSVRTGATLSVQDVTEDYTTLSVTSRKGVDINLTTEELTMRVNDFSNLYMTPAMSRLASEVESDGFAALVAQSGYFVKTASVNSLSFADLNGSNIQLSKQTTPRTNRSVILSPDHVGGYMDATKGLFNPGSTFSQQYNEGMVQDAFGYKAMQSNLIPDYPQVPQLTATFASAGSVDPVTKAVTTISVTAAGASVTYKKGTIFTIAGVYQVNPETKRVYRDLYGFCLTADATTAAGGTATFSVVPFYQTGPFQNVSQTITGTPAITIVGSTTSALTQSIAFNRDAATFATADLLLPSGVDMASRKEGDGVSMRFVRQYGITNDDMPSRFDVLYGWAMLRPEYFVRIIG